MSYTLPYYLPHFFIFYITLSQNLSSSLKNSHEELAVVLCSQRSNGGWIFFLTAISIQITRKLIGLIFNKCGSTSDLLTNFVLR